MRTSVVLLFAVVGGYFAYHLWFAPDEVEEPPIEFVEQPGEAPPGGENGGEAAEKRRDRRASIIIGGRIPRGDVPESEGGENLRLSAQEKRENEGWDLYDKLIAARKANDKEAADIVAQAIRQRYKDTDAHRLLEFDRGRIAFARYERLGRTAEGYAAGQEARRYLTPALFLGDSVVDPKQRDALRKQLRALADDLLFSGRHVEGVDHLYKVKSGDTLERLCYRVFPKKWGVRASPGLVMAINRLRRPRDLRAGVSIRVPIGTPKIVVVKHEFRLYYLLDGAYVRDWTVGLGAKGSTPVGEFAIRSKIENPDWFPRQGVKVPFGNPQNILGTRWMGFADTLEHTGFGIHGTTKPASIGREESSGCVRMLRRDVEDLFSWTPRTTKVEIRR
ncbi:MAG: L,D-transpeptidase family protein [Planctomycetota bacterium]|jgi:hypothetical protein